MTIPRRVRSAVGLIDGDLVEVRAVGKRTVIIPQLVIDRSKFPNADDEYTPEQRRIINARLDEAEKGPFHGPFKDGAEVAVFLKRKSGAPPRRPNQENCDRGKRDRPGSGSEYLRARTNV